MKLSVFGLGYVGCVSAACFAEEGNEVIGVDVNLTNVEIIGIRFWRLVSAEGPARAINYKAKELDVEVPVQPCACQ